jgi:hypothetical protein
VAADWYPIQSCPVTIRSIYDIPPMSYGLGTKSKDLFHSSVVASTRRSTPIMTHPFWRYSFERKKTKTKRVPHTKPNPPDYENKKSCIVGCVLGVCCATYRHTREKLVIGLFFFIVIRTAVYNISKPLFSFFNEKTFDILFM